MRSQSTRQRDLLLALGVLLAGLGAGGCTTLGFAAAGPLFTGVAALADRSVERTVPADQITAWAATVDALSRMAVRLDETDRSGERWQLRGLGEAVTVHGSLDRVTTRMTRVSIRVEAGGLLADKKTGDEILNQISASLASLDRMVRPAEAPPRDLSAERLGTLQREIERLSTKLDAARETPAPASPSPEPAAVHPPTTTGVLVVPISAGVPTTARAPAPDSTPAIVRIPAAPRATSQATSGQVDPHRSLVERILPVGLERVGVLSAAPALSAGRADQ